VDGAFRDPDIPDGERTAYRGVIGGETVGTGEITVHHASENGHELYRQELAADAPGDNAYRLEATFRRARGNIHAETYRLETRQGGDHVATEEGRFRQVKPLHWGGEARAYPRDLVPLLGCAIALRGLEFAPGEERSLSVWLANSVYWEVSAVVQKRETVSVPAGDVEAWPVRLRPSLEQVNASLDKLVGSFLPPIVTHFAAEPPHRLVRFAFPTGPFPWSPAGLVEATELAG
jgi:hypothetical protein